MSKAVHAMAGWGRKGTHWTLCGRLLLYRVREGEWRNGRLTLHVTFDPSKVTCRYCQRCHGNPRKLARLPWE